MDSTITPGFSRIVSFDVPDDPFLHQENRDQVAPVVTTTPTSWGWGESIAMTVATALTGAVKSRVTAATAARAARTATTARVVRAATTARAVRVVRDVIVAKTPVLH